MGYDDASWGAAEWLTMGVLMLLFWGLVAGLVVWAIRSLRPNSTNVSPPDGIGRADQILAERYARGEIEEPEFERRRELLRSANAERTL